MADREESSSDLDRADDLASRVRGVGRSTAATIAARAIDVGATYAFYTVLARSLSVADFGRFILGMTVLQIAALISRYGLDQALLTVPPSGTLNRFAARVVAAISVAMAVTVGVGFQLAGRPLPAFGAWLAAGLPVVVLAQFVIGALRAGGRVSTAATAEGIVQPAGSFLFAAGVALLAPSPEGFAAAFLLSWVIAAGFASRLEWRGPRIDRAAASHLLRTGRSMLGVGLFQQAAASADVLLLGMVASAAELGRYGAAQKVAAAYLLLHGAVGTAATPFMRALADDPRMLMRYHRVVTRWSFTAAIPLLTMTIGVPALVLRLFGSDYAREGTPLILLSFAAAAILLSGPAGSVLLCTGRARELLFVTAAGAATLALSVALLVRFGAIGAAAGVLIGRVIARGLLLVTLRRLVIGSWIDRPLLLIVGAASAGVVIARTAAPWIGEIAAAAGGSFLALAAALGVLIREGDVDFLRSELRGS